MARVPEKPSHAPARADVASVPQRPMSVVSRHVIFWLNRLVPKHNKAVLAGFPDLEDSILEIARQLATRNRITVVVLTEADVPPFARAEGSGIVWCHRASLAGLWHYLTARYVFFTHGLYLSSKPPRSQMCVNVWHGMPIKRIGHLLGRTPPPASVQVATSDLFKGLVARCFGVRESTVLTTGIPRNDVLIRAAARADEIKARICVGSIGSSRLAVWLPTYRRAVRGVIRNDGAVHPSIFGMDDMDTGAFERQLEQLDCTCVVKIHPMAADQNDRIQSDRLVIWRDRDLYDRGVSLYEMVGAADLLITDASSVYVDYLIIDKPVVIAFPDLEAYRRSRGFALEPIEDYFAGPVVSSFAQLTEAITESLGADPYGSKRARIAASFHKHRDDGATARLLDTVLARQPSRRSTAAAAAAFRPM